METPPISLPPKIEVPAPEPDLRPTRARYGVIGFAVVLAIFSYIDRVALSRAAPSIREDLHLSTSQMGYVFAAFATAYALFEIPGGYLGDRLGPRRVLMRIVIWWSFFTAATGAAFNFISLFLTQLLFGAGEAGCFPNIARAFSSWLTRAERTRAQGIIWLAARWGGAFTPLLVVQLLHVLSWRQAFVVFGSLGIIWAVFFYRWFRDHPSQHPSVNAAELALLKDNPPPAKHGGIPWLTFAKSRQVRLLCAQYFCVSFGWYFYITWLPTFVDTFHLPSGEAARLTSLPLLFGGIGAFTCGMLTSRVVKVLGSVRNARKFIAVFGFLGACTLLLIATRLHNPLFIMLSLGFASFCNDLVVPTAWSTCMDVGGKLSGTLSGTMNMMGNFSGSLYPIMTGLIIQWFPGHWDYAIEVSAAIYFLGAVVWLFLDPVEPIRGLEGH